MSFIFSNYLEDDPNRIDKFGTKFWLNKDGEYHRLGGPAIVHADGHEEWFLYGKYHRIDGPARISPLYFEEWYFNGEQHRKNGPAVIYSDGREEYWEHGKRIK